MPPLVSCVVPVRDGEPYIRRALRTILAQTHQPLEIIVVDDGSSDGSADVARRAGVRLIQQANRGLPAARNRGLAAATGEFVAFLDADDLWHREKIARQVAALAADSRPAICLTHYRNFWSGAAREQRRRYRRHPLAEPLPGCIPGTVLASRRVFDTVGNFREDAVFGSQPLWFIEVLRAGLPVHMLEETLLFRRLHDANLTRTARTQCLDAFLRAAKAWVDFKRERGPATRGDSAGRHPFPPRGGSAHG